MVDDCSQLYFGLKQEFEWEVVYSYISKESIFRLRDDKKILSHPDFRSYYKPFRYNVFDEINIYEEFTGIDINDLSSVDNFINKRGILGLHAEYSEKNLMDKIYEYENIQERAIEEDNFDIIKLQYTTRKSLNMLEGFSYWETLGDFIRELKIMKNLLTLNSFDTIKVSVGDEDKVLEVIKQLKDLICEENERYENFTGFEIGFPREIASNTSSFILLQHEAKAIVSKVIERKMRNVKPRIALTFSKGKGYTYISTWQPVSLLGCMYTMIYNDLTLGNRIDICPACNSPVVVRDKRSNSYHSSCQGRKDTAKTRSNQTKKIKKYIIDKYYGNTNIPTSKIIEIETPYIRSNIGKSVPINPTKINRWLGRI